MLYMLVAQKTLAEALDKGDRAFVEIKKLSDREYFELKKNCFVEAVTKNDMATPKQRFLEQVRQQFPRAQWVAETSWKDKRVDYFIHFPEPVEKAG